MKRCLSFIITPVLLFFACTERIADTTGNIYGTVKDATTGEPSYNCNVTLNPVGLATTTGSDGTFQFPNIEGGQYSIQVSKVEYAANSKNITVTPGEEARVDFLLYKESATKGTIHGTIKDSQTGEPLSGCNILLQPTGMSTTTETNGYYVFSNLDPGEYFLSITKSNYHSNSRSNISVKAGETSIVDMLLKEFDSTERLPDVNSLTIEEITSSSARFAAVVSDDGSHNVTECGFIYGLSPSSTTIDSGVKIQATKDNNGRFYADVKGLQSLCRYYVAAYAVNALGVSYSPQMSFTTLQAEITPAPTNVIYVSVAGNDNNDGSSWASAKKTISAAISAAQADMEIWVSAGTWNERIFGLRDGVSIYGGFTGAETAKTERTKKTTITGTVYLYNDAKTSVVDGFIISGVSGLPSQAVVCLQINGVLRNCELLNNKNHIVNGGYVENCIFSGNRETTSALVLISGTAIIINSVFANNNCSGQTTGGMPSSMSGEHKFINCLFANNRNLYISTAHNCTIVNNEYASVSSAYNSILWNNQRTSITNSVETYIIDNNDNSSVRFTHPYSKSGLGTEDWSQYNWSLTAESAYIDKGYNIYYPTDLGTTDLAGNPRISNGTIDIGAYEFKH
ncbi:MAG: carboxypeptidase regulatory-like domain-containing protein [Alistipes senegalensis]|nr:carboxypeptidase regulatory-like domain-containing protein [Alistipes senegalensis]